MEIIFKDVERLNKQEEKSLLAKNKLISAAQKLFNEYEIEKVGIREICAEAGVTTGTFYHHYKSKNDLIVAIYDTHEDRFEIVFNELCQKPSYSAAIVRFFTETLAPMVEADGVDFTLHRLFIMKRHSNEQNKLYKGMKKLIICAIESGEFSSAYNPDKIMTYIFTVFRGTTYEWCIMPEEERGSLSKMLEEAMSYAVKAFV